MNVRNDLQHIQPVAGENQVSAVEKPPSDAATSAPAAGDQAHLSGAASLASHAASLPDIRPDRVQSVQAAIASGSYNISSSDVADSLMQHMIGSQG